MNSSNAKPGKAPTTELARKGAYAPTRLQFVLVLVLVLVGAVLVRLVLDNCILKSNTRREGKLERKHAWVDVPINTESTIRDDLVTIVHHPRTSEIAVHFRPDSRCTHPHLVGRLSGPLLSEISWDALEPPTNHTANHTASHRTRVVTGRYRVPRGGRYFLEIIVIMCQPVAQDTCPEDPKRHRLTAKGAAISIDAEEHRITAAHAGNQAAVGYWYNTAPKASNHEPLYTRYQPLSCKGSITTNANVSRCVLSTTAKTECRAATDLSRFAPYRFYFGGASVNLSRNSLRERLRKLRRDHTVCFVGASHARHLNTTASSLLNGVLGVEYLKVLFADEFNYATTIWLSQRKCTKVVFGFGQWDASYSRGYMTSFADYEQNLSAAVQLLLAVHPPNATGSMDVVCRRTHDSPIGYLNQCIPEDERNPCIVRPSGKTRDWRNPPVIDQYNAILRTVCNRHGLPFLDTGDIMSPVWDSPGDWNHYYDEGSSEAEALYIVDRLFPQ